MSMDANELLSALATGGGAIVGIAAVVGAFIQIRAWIVLPFERIESGMRRIEQDVAKLQLHFDPNGGDLRSRLALVEKRVTTIESTNIAERAALRSSLHDLKTVTDALSERNLR